MPVLDAIPAGPPSPLTRKFFSFLPLSSEGPGHLQQLKTVMATRAAIKTLQETLSDPDEKNPEIIYLLNKTADDLGIKVNDEISEEFESDLDDSVELAFKENLKTELTIENLIHELYADIKDTLDDIQKENITAPAKAKKIKDYLNLYGDDNFTFNIDAKSQEQEIKISLLQRLGSSNNLDLNAAQKIDLGDGAVAYSLPDCGYDLSYVVKQGKRIPLTTYLTEAKKINFNKLINSNIELTSLLYALPENARAAILSKINSSHLNKLITSDAEKMLVMDAIPRSQRTTLPVFFKTLLPGNLQLDPLLKNNFFIPAPKRYVVLDIPLPENPQKLAEFIASADGDKYRKVITDLISKLKAWSTANQPGVNLENFQRLSNILMAYNGLDEQVNKIRFAIYKEAPRLMQGILDELNKPADKSELQRRKTIFNNFVKSLVVCEPGILTHMTNAYGKLVGDVASAIMDVRKDIASQVILEHLKAAQIAREDNIPYEIHYVNSVLNYLSYELGIQKLDDFYAPILETGSHSDIRELALTKIKPALESYFYKDNGFYSKPKSFQHSRKFKRY